MTESQCNHGDIESELAWGSHCGVCTLAELERLREEVEVLRLYGNKDCTNMADAELRRRRGEV